LCSWTSAAEKDVFEPGMTFPFDVPSTLRAR
jgi:hypothetical protein